MPIVAKRKKAPITEGAKPIRSGGPEVVHSQRPRLIPWLTTGRPTFNRADTGMTEPTSGVLPMLFLWATVGWAVLIQLICRMSCTRSLTCVIAFERQKDAKERQEERYLFWEHRPFTWRHLCYTV
jgi:hypothetical protein